MPISGASGLYSWAAAEQKPTPDLNGALGVETDTGLFYLWNGTIWTLQILGGGGGGVGWRLAARWHEARTFTNVGSTFVDVYNLGANGQRQPVNFAGFTQSRFVVHWQKIGTGTQNVRIWDGTNVLHDLADGAAAAEHELDSGWVNLPGTFTGEVNMRVQAKSTVAGDDPVFRGASLYLK